MVGREIDDMYPRRPVVPGAPTPSPTIRSAGDTASSAILTVRNLDVAAVAGESPFLRDLTFALRPGEVLGIGGLMGAGRTELLMHLFGAWGYRIRGDVTLRGERYAFPNPRESIARGLVLATEDRRRYGLVLDQGVGFNLSLSSLRRFTTPTGRINQHAEYARNQQLVDFLRIKTPGQDALTGGLSGGNQQKVVLGKALMTEPAVVMLDEPTRGIDVGTKAEVHRLMSELAGQGLAVLMISSELPEVLGMADRVLVMHEGRLTAELSRAEADEESVIRAATGQVREAAA